MSGGAMVTGPVDIATGQVRGCRIGVVDAFLGIPYAAPPVDDLRFHGPRPHPGWRGVRAADRPGPRPPQLVPLTGGSPWTPAEGAEWLTVNVWAPAGAEGLPVLFWLHGGAFLAGSSGIPLYDGARLAADGVVVVSANYRVGFDGYGHIPGCPDNRGLLDQAAALHWVADNIAGFGGDPGRITVWGQSAGAASALALAAEPATGRLIRRAILQSVPRLTLTGERAALVSGSVAARLGVPATRQGFSSVPPQHLVEALSGLEDELWDRPHRWGALRYAQMPVQPLPGGPGLPVRAEEAVAAGAADGVDMVVGYNRDECRLLFQKHVRRTGPVTEALLSEAAQAFGYAEVPAGASSRTDRYLEMWTRWLFRDPTLAVARARRDRPGAATHVYEFGWRSPAMRGILGACHSLELPFVFGNFANHTARSLVGPETPAVGELSDRMRAAWIGFAATGRAGWAPYDDAGHTELFDAA
jgi:para-nitrobenzyl esterase